MISQTFVRQKADQNLRKIEERKTMEKKKDDVGKVRREEIRTENVWKCMKE